VGTCGALGPAPSLEVGAGTTGPHGAPELPCARRWVLELRGHVVPPELPYARRWALELRRHMAPPELPGVGRWVLEPPPELP
jgi:hypothetical protein